MRSRFNIAPSQTVPIIVKWAEQVEFAQWGFIPAWAKCVDGVIPSGHINIRLESAAEKPSFKNVVYQQHCLIPATGYYEWRTFSGKKQPFYLHLENQPLFALAGLWSIWQTPSGEAKLNFGILTQPAPDFLTTLHDRSPVIISPQKYQSWLENNKKIEIESCILNLEKEKIRCHAVSSRMNHPRFEGKECIQAL